MFIITCKPFFNWFQNKETDGKKIPEYDEKNVFCFQMMMHRLSPEEYILATINLYLDIINLFLELLRIFGQRNNWCNLLLELLRIFGKQNNWCCSSKMFWTEFFNRRYWLSDFDYTYLYYNFILITAQDEDILSHVVILLSSHVVIL